MKTVINPQFQTMKSLRKENNEKEAYLEKANKEVLDLHFNKEKIKDLKYEINALENKIPSYELSLMLASDIYDYVSAYGFENSQVQLSEEVLHKKEAYTTIPVHIKFQSAYSEALRFVEKLNRSNQIITLDYFSIKSNMEKENITAEITILVHYIDSREGEA